MFLSTYDSKVDGKSRVSVPAAFRKVLGGDDSVFIWPSIDKTKRCLEGGGRDLIVNYQKAISRLKPMDPRRRALEYGLLGQCKEFTFDAGGGGRIVLHKDFKEFADITDDVKFVGLGDRFEIWSVKDHESMARDMVDLAGESLDLIDTFNSVMHDFGEVSS
ncbi:MAG: division/cell wall cluster transcriptional repressor MraZ [Hirschia sp.]|nr:division/cell wall cluster transcriptional repressor MraZ [Hirschia sp.]MBF18495.1 division/cell wall cluster transcriptional repressor MraZ [Hirschia sp.]|tara:strand:- start:13 stop:495 length:483 start_codon:yes stop_codon:yes gene_type:complete